MVVASLRPGIHRPPPHGGACTQPSPLMPKGELTGVWTWCFALDAVAPPLWIPAFAGMTVVAHRTPGDIPRSRRAPFAVRRGVVLVLRFPIVAISSSIRSVHQMAPTSGERSGD